MQTGTRQTQPASFLRFITTTTPGETTHTHSHTHRKNERDAANDKWEQQLVETATQKEDTK